MPSHAVAGAVVFAKNPANVARFYVGVLGARVVSAELGSIVLATEATELVVHAIPPQIAQHITIQDPPALREDTAIKMFFVVASLSTVREKATLLGGGLLPPEKVWMAPGFCACDGWDPEGNVVQFRESVV